MVERKSKRPSVKDTTDTIDVFSFLSIQELLKSIYAELKKQNPRYSYRSFSHDLGFGETNYLHLICTQKRQLSPRSAQQVAQHLGLHSERRKWFLSLVEHTGGRRLEQRTAGIKKAFDIRQKTLENDLSRDEMEFFSTWYHPVVRELVGHPDFSGEPRWIASRLRPKITVEQAKQSLELLIRLGYIEKNEDMKFHLTHSALRVPEGATHLAIHHYHQEMLQLSARSLSETEPENRDISALTVSLSPAQVSEVKLLLKETRKKIVTLSEQKKKSAEIYQFNMQLFPVSGDDK